MPSLGENMIFSFFIHQFNVMLKNVFSQGIMSDLVRFFDNDNS